MFPYWIQTKPLDCQQQYMYCASKYIHIYLVKVVYSFLTSQMIKRKKKYENTIIFIPIDHELDKQPSQNVTKISIHQ